MQKIPTMFVRDPDDRAHVLDQVTPGCEWVLAGEGTATRKWDGTCVMLDDDGAWWARREVKPGKTPPPGFVPLHTDGVKPGTYELLGPKINGNPDSFDRHLVVKHGWAPFTERLDLETAPRDYAGLAAWLRERPYEGIVFHHPDGRMAKIKARDFPG